MFNHFADFWIYMFLHLSTLLKKKHRPRPTPSYISFLLVIFFFHSTHIISQKAFMTVVYLNINFHKSRFVKLQYCARKTFISSLIFIFHICLRDIVFLIAWRTHIYEKTPEIANVNILRMLIFFNNISTNLDSLRSCIYNAT